MKANGWQVSKRSSAAPLSGSSPSPTRLRLLTFIRFAWRRYVAGPTPHFAKYQPAPRLGTRRVEQRLLSRLAGTQLGTAC
jgi:hypothetical protein